MGCEEEMTLKNHPLISLHVQKRGKQGERDMIDEAVDASGWKRRLCAGAQPFELFLLY